YLVYKLKIQTFDPNEKYFFFLPLIALPVGLEFVRVFFAGLGRRRICGVVALGVVAACSVVPFNWVKGMTPDSPLYLSAESIPLIEALKGVPPTEALYIDGGLNWLLTIPTVLIYLKRDPQIYHSSPGNVLTSKTEYYLLTTEFLPSNMPQTEAVKVRDYRACGYDDLALYRITKFKTENEKTLPGPAGEGV
ncbi:MAG: hypothetical protein KTQ49_07260, partial [Candidatus Omnitrophica bacterium]|nr:hypothetical protein [Candidatus Omnitrophota bacterium]